MPIRKAPTDCPEGFRGRAALVLTFPGEELQVWSWLTAYDPLVCILADGPGRASTARNLLRVGVRIGSVFCRTTFDGIERTLASGDYTRFVSLAEELGDEFARYDIDYVVGGPEIAASSIERASRSILDAAIGLAARSNPGLRSWQIAPADSESPAPEIRLEADGECWQAKRRAIQNHSHWPEPLGRHIRECGMDAVRLERFRVARPFAPVEREHVDSPIRLRRASAQASIDSLVQLRETLRQHVAGYSRRTAA